MPKKITIANLLKRSTRERALVLCDDFIIQSWHGSQNFTEAERDTIRESFITDQQQQIWEQILAQEMKIRNFIPYLEDRMTQALESTYFFYSAKARYIENIGNEKAINHLLSDIQECVPDNKLLHEKIALTLNFHAFETFKTLKFTPPATVKLTPYSGEKSFTELLKKAGMDITERVKIAKTHIAAMRQFMDNNRCHFKVYDKRIKKKIEDLKSYIVTVPDTIKMLKTLRKGGRIKWTDTEIFTTEWLPPAYNEIPINQTVFNAACVWFEGET